MRDIFNDANFYFEDSIIHTLINTCNTLEKICIIICIQGSVSNCKQGIVNNFVQGIVNTLMKIASFEISADIFKDANSVKSKFHYIQNNCISKNLILKYK